MQSHVVEKIELPTINRGNTTFIISVNRKGYFAHELTGLTQWAKVTGNGEQKASRINQMIKRGNQYGRFFKPKPFASIHAARIAVQMTANLNIIHF